MCVLVPQNRLEDFPVGTVRRCQALSDSLLALVCKEAGQHKPDLHLFQCDGTKVGRL